MGQARLLAANEGGELLGRLGFELTRALVADKMNEAFFLQGFEGMVDGGTLEICFAGQVTGAPAVAFEGIEVHVYLGGGEAEGFE